MEVFNILFVAILGFSIIGNFFSIPGNFIIVLNTFWYGLVTGFHQYSLSFLITLLLIALLVEFLEYVVIAFGARRYGASRAAVIVGILSGIAGGISGFFVSPVLGALIGGFIGVILGSLSIELIRGKGLRESLTAAYGAVLGRVGGLTVKALGTVVMIAILATKLAL